MLSSVAILLQLLAATVVVADQETCDTLNGKENCQQKKMFPSELFATESDDDGQVLLQKPGSISKSEIQMHATHDLSSKGEFTLKLHTCDRKNAGSDSDLEVLVGSSWHELDNWGNDRERDDWDTYTLSGDAPSDIKLRSLGSDGWCVDQIEINGVAVYGMLPLWLDSPCQESYYDDHIPCKSSASFSTQAPTPVPSQADQDLLTVMTFNTYLLRVQIIIAIDTRPNLDERQELIAKWFKDLDDAAIPDVLVMQEIYSHEAQTMLRAMCNPIWTKNSETLGGHSHNPFIPCNVDGTKFAYATKCVNPTRTIDPRKTGGVVVLVKKGLEMISADDVPYEDCAGEECYTILGFWAVKLRKGSQPYWFFGTHAIAYEQPKYIDIRQKQFKQMRKYIDDNVEGGARLAIAGDMNIFTGKYTDKDDIEHEPNETEPMLANLGAGPNAPAIGGEHVPRGFWLPLNSSMSASADPVLNHVISAIPAEARLGHQRFDWVITPGPGDSFPTPQHMRYQIVPVKSDTCFVTKQEGYAEGTTTDDLSDHYAVYAEIRWTESAPECQPANGHRGAGTTIPAGPTC